MGPAQTDWCPNYLHGQPIGVRAMSGLPSINARKIQQVPPPVKSQLAIWHGLMDGSLGLLPHGSIVNWESGVMFILNFLR